MRAAAALPSAFSIGQRNGDATMIEFFDYNCPWCRQAARDLDPLLKSEPRLRVLLVNYAVLGVPSVLAGKVAVAVASDYAGEVSRLPSRDVRAARDGRRR